MIHSPATIPVMYTECNSLAEKIMHRIDRALEKARDYYISNQDASLVVEGRIEPSELAEIIWDKLMDVDELKALIEGKEKNGICS